MAIIMTENPACALKWQVYHHVLFHTPITFSLMAAQLYKTASGRLFHAGAVAIITVG